MTGGTAADDRDGGARGDSGDASGGDGAARDTDARAKSLLARWQKDDDVDALDELLRSEVQSVARRLRARWGGAMSASMSASDLAQEAVFRLLRLEDVPEFTDPAALRAYLWKSAWRLLVNRTQAPGRDVVRLSGTDTHSLSGALGTSGGIGALDQADQHTALEVVINLLKPEDRDALRWIYIEGLSIDAAAKRAGITRAALDTRLMRARQRLAMRLVDWADVVG